VGINGGYTFMQDCSTGQILFSSTSAYKVFDDALGALPSGGTLFTKAGTYTIGTSIVATGLSNVIWTGEGTGTVLSADAPLTKAGSCINNDLICLYNDQDWTLSNMELQGNAASQSASGESPALIGIEVQNSEYVTLQGLTIYSFKTNGMAFVDSTNSQLTSSTLAYNRANGADCNHGSDWITFQGNTINGDSDVGISIAQCFDTILEDNTVMNMTSTNSPSGLNTQTGIYVGDTMNATRVAVENNVVENTGYYGIDLTADEGPTLMSYDLSASGNQIINCAGGITVTYVEGATVTGNLIQSSIGPHYAINIGAGVSNGVVSENQIPGEGPASIYVQSGDVNIQVKNNTFTTTST
jgi:hypothetical protein